MTHPGEHLMKSLALALCLAAAGLHAQSKTGTTIGQFTLIDPGARSAAMGGAGVTSSAEAVASFYNPGALGALERSDFQFTYTQWLAGITVSNAIAAVRIGSIGTAALAVTNLSSGDIPVTTVEQPLGTGEQFNVSDLLVGIGWGMAVTDRFSFGIQANYVSERIWHSSVAVFGVNIGTIYQLSPDGLRIGASLVNFGTKGRFDGTDLRVSYNEDPARYGANSTLPATLNTDYFTLPIVFRVGLGYPVVFDGANTLTLAVDAIHPSDEAESVNMGAEWAFQRVLFLRVGYQSLFLKDSEVGLTAGGGVQWDGLGYDLRLDYAWASFGRLGGVQRVTLAFAF
jgi:hypothetical protein